MAVGSQGEAMSVQKSIMPRGTRQAALIAFCIAACLFAWRGNVLLTGSHAQPAPAPASGPASLDALIEPVLGRGNFRTATHTGESGEKSVLILVDAPKDRFHLNGEIHGRIETILMAATGFDPEHDRLQIQPFAFAAGTRGGLSQTSFLELSALGLLTGLLGFVAFSSGNASPLQTRTPANDPAPEPGTLQGAHLRAIPLDDTPERPAAPSEAQRLAQSDPKRAANIIKRWMNDGSPS